MEDRFNKTLWELGLNNPEAQKAIVKSMSKDSGGYSIPTGDITLAIYEAELEESQRAKIVTAIEKARELKVKDLARILGELSVALTLEDVNGGKLEEPERTLKDIDITALATWALVKWLANVEHAERS